jgi:Spy/CpxP family protein refolding chaperone
MIRVLVLLSAAGYAQAQPETTHETPHTAELYLGGSLLADPHLPPAQRSIALTKEQREKLYEIFHAQDSVLHRQTRTLQDAQEEMRRLAASSDYSEMKARALAEVVAKATAEIAFLVSRSDHQLFEILTPEQREQVTAVFHPTTTTPPTARKLMVWRQ